MRNIDTITKELKENQIQTTVTYCTLRAASEITVEPGTSDLKNYVLKVLQEPKQIDWQKAVLHHVVINNTLDYRNDEKSLSQTVDACKRALYALSGTPLPPANNGLS